jgi:hypothetical protein
MATATATAPTPIITSLPHTPPMRYPSPTYTSQASITPPDSDSSSPRSPGINANLPPHLQSQAKQLRTPRSPMYVPAVLRPTEKPYKSSPPKRDGKLVVDGPAAEEEVPEEGQSILIRRVVTEEWNESQMDPVSGPPSKNHWKVSFPSNPSTSNLFHSICPVYPLEQPVQKLFSPFPSYWTLFKPKL